MYFDIEDDLWTLKYESELDDDPEITLVSLLSDLLDKRVVLLSTHGDLDTVTFDGRMAVEYFASRQARNSALGAYYDLGYFTMDDIVAGQTEVAGDSVYVIALTDEGIRNHFRGLMAEDALFYGDYCYSYYQADDWFTSFPSELDGPSHFGYTEDVTSSVACDNLVSVWSILGCKCPEEGSNTGVAY